MDVDEQTATSVMDAGTNGVMDAETEVVSVRAFIDSTSNAIRETLCHSKVYACAFNTIQVLLSLLMIASRNVNLFDEYSPPSMLLKESFKFEYLLFVEDKLAITNKALPYNLKICEFDKDRGKSLKYINDLIAETTKGLIKDFVKLQDIANSIVQFIAVSYMKLKWQPALNVKGTSIRVGTEEYDGFWFKREVMAAKGADGSWTVKIPCEDDFYMVISDSDQYQDLQFEPTMMEVHVLSFKFNQECDSTELIKQLLGGEDFGKFVGLRPQDVEINSFKTLLVGRVTSKGAEVASAGLAGLESKGLSQIPKCTFINFTWSFMYNNTVLCEGRVEGADPACRTSNAEVAEVYNTELTHHELAKECGMDEMEISDLVPVALVNTPVVHEYKGNKTEDPFNYYAKFMDKLYDGQRFVKIFMYLVFSQIIYFSISDLNTYSRTEEHRMALQYDSLDQLMAIYGDSKFHMLTWFLLHADPSEIFIVMFMSMKYSLTGKTQAITTEALENLNLLCKKQFRGYSGSQSDILRLLQDKEHRICMMTFMLGLKCEHFRPILSTAVKSFTCVQRKSCVGDRNKFDSDMILLYLSCHLNILRGEFAGFETYLRNIANTTCCIDTPVLFICNGKVITMEQLNQGVCSLEETQHESYKMAESEREYIEEARKYQDAVQRRRICAEKFHKVLIELKSQSQ